MLRYNPHRLIGMTWALFVAGVPTTVASQWAVPSKSTAKLMVAFHENAKKMTKADALRQAALHMIKEPRFRISPTTGLASSWWETVEIK
jgi:CHAT domain-containing protein